MSQLFSELIETALSVRDHYGELEEINGSRRWNAQDRMAGFVVDVGDLSKLIMAKYKLRPGPDNLDDIIAHELSDCLWCVMVLSDELGVDIEKAFTENMQKLHKRIDKEKSETL